MFNPIKKNNSLKYYTNVRLIFSAYNHFFFFSLVKMAAILVYHRKVDKLYFHLNMMIQLIVHPKKINMDHNMDNMVHHTIIMDHVDQLDVVVLARRVIYLCQIHLNHHHHHHAITIKIIQVLMTAKRAMR